MNEKKRVEELTAALITAYRIAREKAPKECELDAMWYHEQLCRIRTVLVPLVPENEIPGSVA